MNFALFSKFLVESQDQSLTLSHKILCGINPSWWVLFEQFTNSRENPPPPINNPKILTPELILVPVPTFLYLQKTFKGGPKIDVFIINQVPDFSPIEIWVCFEDPSDLKNFKVFAVSLQISVKDLKDYVCEDLEIDSHKAVMRIIDELQTGTTAFRSISEESSVKNAGIKQGSKICVSKPKKRVVRFVESDEEQDKIVEISIKANHSNDSHEILDNFSESESKKIEEKRHRLKIRSLKSICNSLSRIFEQLSNR